MTPDNTNSTAIRNLSGFTLYNLPANDDGSTGAVPLNFDADFFGKSYSSLYVNNNGNVTFDGPSNAYSPFGLNSTHQAIIAPFFADVDTRGTGSGIVTYGNDLVDGHTAFGVDWFNVGYWNHHTSNPNTFQLVLIDRSDVQVGDFDIEFDYSSIQWESGDYTGGVGGLGGTSAHAGYSNGSGNPGTSFELSGSGVDGAFLDSNQSTGLIYNSFNSTQSGRYVWEVRNGSVVELPDLVVTKITAPTAADWGSTIGVSWTVTNQGAGVAQANWSDDIYLSTSTNLDASAILLPLQPATTETDLAAGGSYTLTRNVVIPNLDPNKTWYLLVKTDTNNTQSETNENNNVSAVALTVNAPDLVVSNDTVSPIATLGSTIPVTWTIKNQGTGAAVDSWYDSVYLSSQPTLDSSATLLTNLRRDNSNLPLAAGASYIESSNLTIPNVAPGDWYLLFTTDSSNSQPETDETNNVIAQKITLGAPDLVVSDATTPATASLDQTIQVGWTVTNQGTFAAPANWVDAVYLSDKPSLNTTATQLIADPIANTTPLVAGSSYSQQVNVTIPQTATIGSKYLLFVTNANNNQGESDPTNNIKAISITVQAPNLTVNNIVTPADAWSGRGLDVTWTVTNNGNEATRGNWIDKVYLSSDDMAGSDLYLGELDSPENLDPGQSYTRSQTFVLPNGVSGNYRLKVVADANNSIVESSSARSDSTSTSGAFAVNLTPYADLQVASVTVPPTAAAGQEATFSWIVTNKGTGATDASAWSDNLYLSTDPTFNSNDILLGTVTNPSYLAPGESYSQTLTATLPSNLSGQYYAIVDTNATHTQYEYNFGNNNTGASTQRVQIAAPVLGYLHVADVETYPTAPTPIYAGQPITAIWTVKNTGDGTVTPGNQGYWDDGFALSPTPTWDGTHGYWLGGHQDARTTPLAPGESYTYHNTITLPQNISGTWYLVSVPDTHEWTGGGPIGSSIVPKDQGSVALNIQLPPSADLQVESVVATHTGSSGQPINVTWTVSNEGFGSTEANAWTDSIYLSTNPTLETSGTNADTLLGSFTHYGSLAAVENYTQTESVTLPSDISGPYYIFVLTDSGNNVFEHADSYDAESNNANYDPTPIQVTLVPPPDLQVTALTLPSAANSGQGITVNWTVTNKGTQPTGVSNWSDSIVLSSDSSNTTVQLAVVNHTGALAPGESYNGSQTVVLPNGIWGPYHILVTTDATNNVPEPSSQNNKTTTAALTINLTPSPDLQVTAVQSPTGSSGQDLQVSWTVTNNGRGDTPPLQTNWTDDLYLSANNTLDPNNATLLGQFRHSGALTAGSSYTASQKVTLPVGISGNYNLFVVTDAGNEVFEPGTKNDNVGSSPLAINLTPPPELQVSSIDAPTNAYSSQPITVNWTITNTGIGNTVPSSWYDSVYLSKDQFFDPNANIYLGSVEHDGSLASGAAYSASLSANVPANASGPYYVFVVTDSAHKVFEASADNNAKFAPTAVNVTLAPPADLITNTVSVPATGIVGQSSSGAISWTVTNSGTNPAVGTWTDAVYLSPDGNWNVSDPLVAQVVHTGDLAAGASYTATTDAPLPAVAPGNYYVIVRSDIRNNVRESNKTNNQAVSTATIAVDMPVLSFDVTNSGTLSSNQDVYYRIDTQAGQDVQLKANFTESDQAEFYVRYGAPPTTGEFDEVYSNPSDLEQEIKLSGTRAGSYYILVHGRQEAGINQAFSLTANQLDFELSQVTSNHGSNVGQATLTLEGAKFTSDAQVSLIAPDGSSRMASSVLWKDSNTIWATFDLRGLAPQQYDVRVDEDGKSTVLKDAYTVNTGAPGNLETHIVGPGALRPGQQGTITVEYTNTGETDLVAPFILLSAQNANLQIPGQSGFTNSSVQFLGINTDGPVGILSPGATSSVSFAFMPTTSTGTVDFSLQTQSGTDQPIDWSTLKDEARPNSVPDNFWNALWSNFTASVGTTVSDYQTVLANNATRLGQLGEYTGDLSRLVKFEFQQAENTFSAPVAASAVDAADGTPGLPLEFERVFQPSLVGRYTLGPLGYGWTTPWDVSLSTDSAGNITIEDAGSERVFLHQSDGTYVGLSGDKAMLTLEQGLYQLQETDGTLSVFQSDGKLDYIQDTNNNRITAVYTGNQLTSLVHSNGDSLTFSYNAQGRITQVTDSSGLTTTYTYDAVGEHLLSATNSYGTTQYSYDTSNDIFRQNALLSITYPDNTHHYFDYDNQGRLIRESADGGANAVSYAYDGSGGVTVSDATGTTKLLLDDTGQTGQFQDALGHITQLSYDINGNLVSLTAPGGIAYTYNYDSQGNLTSQIDPLGERVNLSYDPTLNRLLSIQDQRGNTIGYSYDSQGNPTGITYADGSHEQFSCDASGNLTQSTDRRNIPIRYTYNNDGLLTRQDYADGSSAQYSYDTHGNLTAATDIQGITTMEYDSADQLTRITYPSGRYLQFTYDAGGRRTQMVDQDGFTVKYSYDNVGRLVGLTDGKGATIITYSYDSASRLTREEHGNGTYTTYSYDPAGQLAQLTNYAPDGKVNSSFSYTYDDLGRQASMATLDGLWTYQYDAIDQLTHAVFASTNPNVANQDLTYIYDAAGNRIRTIENNATTEYATNNLNQYTSAGNASYQYDAAGNLISQVENGKTSTFTYDEQNRLIGVNGPDGTWNYEYDVFGDRTATIHNGQRTDYLIDPTGMGDVVSEYNGNGSLIADYTYGLGLASRTDTNNISDYYDFDATGSTAGLTGTSGTYLDTYRYLPFGESSTSTESVANPFEYVGQWGVMHDDNDLDFMRARYYTPSEGRFINPDPTGVAGGIDLYSYTTNDPTNLIDPSGLYYESVGGSAAGTSIVLISGSEGAGLSTGRSTGRPSFEYTINPFQDPSPGPSIRVRVGVGIGVGVVSFRGFNKPPLVEVGVGTPGFNVSRVQTFYPLPPFREPRLPPANPSPLPEPSPQPGPSPTPEPSPQPSQTPPPQPQEPWRLPDWFPPLPLPDWRRNVPAIFWHLPLIAPRDPNDIVGPVGFGEQHWVTAKDTLPYTIRFENATDATAPVHQVQITQKLDSKLDQRTFQLGDFGW